MIIRHTSRRNWVVVDSFAVNDDRLSYRARGILVWLLAKPDGWDTRSEGIVKHGPEGRDAIRTALRELETLGYLERRKEQDAKGRWTTYTYLHEMPPDRSLETRRSVDQALSSKYPEQVSNSEKSVEDDLSDVVDNFMGYDYPEEVTPPPDLSSLRDKIVAHKGQRLPGEKPRA